MAGSIGVMAAVRREGSERENATPLLHEGGGMVLSIRREIGLGRASCESGQVRKEAAAVSFARVMCSVSHLPKICFYHPVI